MSASVNKVIIVGNLGADPDQRFTPGGQAVCELRVATQEVWNDKNGQRQERTEWHRVQVWGKQAEACGKYLAKGRSVYVEGRIQTRTFDDKNGVKRYITEVVASDVKFLGGGDKKADVPAADPAPVDNAPAAATEDPFADLP